MSDRIQTTLFLAYAAFVTYAVLAAVVLPTR
jgi:hypothetical protein